MSSTRLLAAAATVLVLFACKRPQPAAAPAASTGGGEVVAEVNGTTITRAELDGRAGSRLARFEQEQYEVRRAALDEMIDERLLEAEAKARGITREDLLRDEVERQVGTPAAGEVEAIYEANKSRVKGLTRAEAVARIERMLRERDAAGRRQEFLGKLREKARIKVSLAAPRSEVTVPAGAPTLGPADAAVKIVEFADYQCPYCHRAQVTVDEVMKRYAGQVALVHRDFPLEGHEGAFPAARAARCAGEQGRFWEYHRSLMTVGGDLSQTDLLSRAAGFDLDAAAFGACLGSDRHDAAIRESLDAGVKMGVTGTPAFFINGRLLSGARPFEDFKKIIEEELGRAS